MPKSYSEVILSVVEWQQVDFEISFDYYPHVSPLFNSFGIRPPAIIHRGYPAKKALSAMRKHGG